MAATYIGIESMTRGGSEDADFSRTFTVTHLVSCAFGDDWGTARAVVPVEIGDTYEGTDAGIDTESLCSKISGKESSESPGLWRFDVEYTSKDLPDPQFNPPSGTSPVEQDYPEIGWEFAKYQKPSQRDAYGKVYANSAGVPVERDIDDSRPVVTITRNESVYVGAAVALAYRDAVCSEPFMGAAALTAKIQSIRGQHAYEKNVSFQKVTYVIEFDPDTWRHYELDAGKAELVSGNLRVIVGLDGTPISEPVPLNGLGRVLSESDTVLNGDITAVATSLTVDVANYPAVPFEVKIGSEIIRVTARTGVNLTGLIRGYAGTTAAAHSLNDPVTMQAYFIEFRDYPELPFSPLNLPGA